jgi:hypothetical protein
VFPVFAQREGLSMEPQACGPNVQRASNLLIKPLKRLVRNKLEVLTVPEGIIQVCSMDFFHDQHGR